jgi:hypothetical protein
MKMKTWALLNLCLVAGMAVGCDEHALAGCGPYDQPKPEAPPAATMPSLSCNSNPDNWAASPERRGPTRLAEVQAAAEATQKSLPNLFDGDKLVGDCHASANIFWLALTKEIRSRGICAWPGPDAIHPASTVPGIAEEYHLITYGGCTLWPASRNNYKGDWIIK